MASRSQCRAALRMKKVLGDGPPSPVSASRVRERSSRASGSPASADELFGLGVHHALRARFSIERGRWWQAEHWIGSVREQAFLLACRRRGLEGGRRFDDLPAEALAAFESTLVRSLDPEELDRALSSAISVLRRESEEAAELTAAVAEQLQALASPM